MGCPTRRLLHAANLLNTLLQGCSKLFLYQTKQWCYIKYMTSKFHFRNTKQHWVAAAILAPLLLITVPVTAFMLAGYIGSEIPLHFPSGSYKEVLNVRQVTDRKLFDAAAQCFAGRGLPHRIIKNSSIQVQESLFRTSIMRCYDELSNAKLSTQDPEWTKTQQFWHGR